MPSKFPYQPITWLDQHLRLLDQRLLPQKLIYNDYYDYRQVAEAIRTMVVRGAPAIGITAGYGMVLATTQNEFSAPATLRTELAAAGAVLRAARPTAVNLSYAIDRVLNAATPALKTVNALREAVLLEAQAIDAHEREANFQIGQNALPLVPEKATFIHHCNTGPLATGYYGTALGVIIAAHQAGKEVFVYVDETRPRLQGARLTTWELQQLDVPHTLIVDGAAAHIMRTRGVDLCVVGCDRVAANGDTANKIGTYGLALAAHAHGIPFYVVGPTTTIDMTLANGDEIEIEERAASEVTHMLGQPVAPTGTAATNIAFDVTPAQYITAIITERGVAYPPFEESLANKFAATVAKSPYRD